MTRALTRDSKENQSSSPLPRPIKIELGSLEGLFNVLSVS